MKGNVSGYVCNHGSPSGERDTASPRLWAMLRTQASDEEANDVFSRRPLYCGRAGSDVIGCRRPTSGVFIYVYFKHGSRWRRSPIATPRGRSVSFPTRVTMVTYSNQRRFLCLIWGEFKRWRGLEEKKLDHSPLKIVTLANWWQNTSLKMFLKKKKTCFNN